ncbi:hypothetical protein ACH6EH_07120 [Paenibacillus sp. JSM ZJ436]|uniref:hypothetical protein n=1 Tax=Paenibacillus sp. JSM ZJ436 TaxID=3376190 RepID=UPI00379E90EB
MIEKLVHNCWLSIEGKDVKKEDVIRYITDRSIVYKVEQDPYMTGFGVYNFALSETTGYRAECPINYEYYRCSSKEHGASCDTCCNWNPEDADKVQLIDPNK